MAKKATDLGFSEAFKENFRTIADQLHDNASSILSQIENYIVSSENQLQQCFNELRLREESVERRAEELDVREKEIQESVREKMKEVDLSRELARRKLEELGDKEDELFWTEKLNQEQIIEISSMGEAVDVKLAELNLKEEKFLLKQKSFEKRCKDLELKEKLFEERNSAMIAKEKSCEENCREVELKEKRVEELSEELRKKQKSFGKSCNDLELKVKRFEELYSGMITQKKSYEESCREIKLKEKKMEELRKEYESKSEELEHHFNQCEKRFQQIEIQEGKLKLKKKKLKEWSEELELKEKRLADIPHSHGELETTEDSVEGNTAILRFFVEMDGKDLQIFLNERLNEHAVMRDDMAQALRFSSNPAKLVLDAIDGFYPPYLKKGDREFEGDTVKSSCILLLEQLRKFSPEIKPQVREEAKKVAIDWITTMGKDASYPLEVLGFLHLLACFRLADDFGDDELFNLYKKVPQDSQDAELLQALGLAHKTSSFIQDLIQGNQHVEAIRYISKFGLVNEFPILPILEDYFRHSVVESKDTLNDGNKTLEALNGATSKKLEDLKDVLRCIVDHKLESEASPEHLEVLKNKIASLEKQNADVDLTLPIDSNDQPPSPSEKRYIAATPAPASALTLESPSQQQRGINHQCTIELAEAVPDVVDPTCTNPPVQLPSQQSTISSTNTASCIVPTHGTMEECLPTNPQLESRKVSSSGGPQQVHHFDTSSDGDVLRFLLQKPKKVKVTGSEIMDALQLVSDPARLVLEVVFGCGSSNMEKNEGFDLCVPQKRCILLLGLLRRILPKIKQQVKDEAKKYAMNWQRKLVKKREGLEVTCFLQFLAAYRLATIFKQHELLDLLDNNHWRQMAPDLCQVLGLENAIPKFIKKQINKGLHLEAVKYICSLDMVHKFPPLPLLKKHLENLKKAARNACRKRKKNVPAKISAIQKELDDIKIVKRLLVNYKLESEVLGDVLKNRVAQLQKEKAKKKSGLPTVLNTQAQKHGGNEKADQQFGLPTTLETLPLQWSGNENGEKQPEHPAVLETKSQPQSGNEKAEKQPEHPTLFETNSQQRSGNEKAEKQSEHPTLFETNSQQQSENETAEKQSKRPTLLETQPQQHCGNKRPRTHASSPRHSMQAGPQLSQDSMIEAMPQLSKGTTETGLADYRNANRHMSQNLGNFSYHNWNMHPGCGNRQLPPFGSPVDGPPGDGHWSLPFGGPKDASPLLPPLGCYRGPVPCRGFGVPEVDVPSPLPPGPPPQLLPGRPPSLPPSSFHHQPMPCGGFRVPKVAGPPPQLVPNLQPPLPPGLPPASSRPCFRHLPMPYCPKDAPVPTPPFFHHGQVPFNGSNLPRT
ncbi:hypothetical protein SLEP1_g19306 [Rubroshorea leprosula]|nr:hypothetical protein SLEP1_g19306 [Rubroshorea leprosula]